MKSVQILVVLLLSSVAFTFGAGNAVYLAGSTATSTSVIAYPSLDGFLTCTTDSTADSPYVSFTVNISATGVYWITAIFEESEQDGFSNTADDSSITMYPATGTALFVPATPCLNAVVGPLNSQSDRAPHAFASAWLTAGLYTLVVVTENSDEAGTFVVHVDPADWYNSTSYAGPYWDRPVEENLYDCETEGEDSESYTYWKWTQATSGYYDIWVVFQNTTSGADYNDFVIALFNGTLSWLGTGTYAAPADPCPTAASGFMISNSEYDGSITTDLGLSQSQFYYIWLTAGTTYTLVASADGSDATNGLFSARIVPTVWRQFGSATFTLPETDTTPCSTTGSTAYVFGTNVFTAAYTTYVIANLEVDDYFFDDLYSDTEFALYSGSSAPTPCGANFIQSVDYDESIASTSFVLGTNYTVVASQSGNEENWYAVLIYGGSGSGGSATNGGTSAGTSNGVTSAGTSNGVTSNGGTSTAGSTSSSHGSSATAVVVDVVVVMIALIASFL
jgi:hypothetical protein